MPIKLRKVGKIHKKNEWMEGKMDGWMGKNRTSIFNSVEGFSVMRRRLFPEVSHPDVLLFV